MSGSMSLPASPFGCSWARPGSEATHGNAQRQQRRWGEKERAGCVARLREPGALGGGGCLRRGRRGGNPEPVRHGSSGNQARPHSPRFRYWPMPSRPRQVGPSTISWPRRNTFRDAAPRTSQRERLRTVAAEPQPAPAPCGVTRHAICACHSGTRSRGASSSLGLPATSCRPAWSAV